MLESDTTNSTTWSDETIRIVAVALGITLVVLIAITYSVWGHLLVAVALVYLLSPFIAVLQRRLRFPQWLAILTAYTVALLFFLLLLLLLPVVLLSFIELGAGLKEALEAFINWLTGMLQSLNSVQILEGEVGLSFVIEPLLDSLSDFSPIVFVPEVVQLLGNLLGFAGRTAIRLVDIGLSFGFAILIILSYAVYMSADNGRIHRTVVNSIPPAYRNELTTLGSRIRMVWKTYVRGQLGVMLAVGIVTTIIAWLLGIPAPLALGIIAGLLEIIPYLGPIIAAVPAVILALFLGSTRFDISNLLFALIVIFAYTLIQQFEDLVLTPKIQGKATELPPLIVMISIVVAFNLAGVFGAIIAIPLVATGREIFNYLSAKLQKQNPYPVEVMSESNT